MAVTRTKKFTNQIRNRVSCIHIVLNSELRTLSPRILFFFQKITSGTQRACTHESCDHNFISYTSHTFIPGKYFTSQDSDSGGRSLVGRKTACCLCSSDERLYPPIPSSLAPAESSVADRRRVSGIGRTAPMGSETAHGSAVRKARFLGAESDGEYSEHAQDGRRPALQPPLAGPRAALAWSATGYDQAGWVQ